MEPYGRGGYLRWLLPEVGVGVPCRRAWDVALVQKWARSLTEFPLTQCSQLTER